MLDHPLNIKLVNQTTDSDGANYGKFVIEPLERGYGTTLGNALRRVLYSGMSGCAVTAARIDGASHEYMSLPNIKEDVLDILLNLKGVVLKATGDDTKILRINANQPGPVYAGDIELPADVKVVNPDWLICTVSDGGNFSAELTAEVGKGYMTSDPHAREKSQSVDTLGIDAVFMPVRRVAYQVENMRVGQRVDFDRLVLEVWTNGSVDCQSALSHAANLLIEHFLPIASLAGTPTSFSQAQQSTAVADDVEVNDPGISIEDLELSVRAYNCLKRAGIHSMSELMTRTENDLLNIKNFGKKSAEEVIDRLKAFGIILKPGAEMPEEVGA